MVNHQYWWLQVTSRHQLFGKSHIFLFPQVNLFNLHSTTISLNELKFPLIIIYSYGPGHGVNGMTERYLSLRTVKGASESSPSS